MEVTNEKKKPTWDDLTPFVNGNIMSHDAFQLLYRLPQTQRTYVLQREEKRRFYVHYSDFIKHKFLSFDVHRVADDDGTEKLKALPAPRTKQDMVLNLVLNDFPCEVQTPLQHYVLFATHPLSTAEVQSKITSEFPTNDYMWWENPTWRRSVPEVFHIHAFIRATKWTELQQFVTNNELDTDGCESLHRCSQVTKLYKKQREETEDLWVNYSDFIKYRYLRFQVECEGNTKRLRAVPKWDGYQHVELHRNAFPYSLEPSLKHLVLWSTHHLNEKEITDNILECYPSQEYIWWENPLHKKTIPDVFHVHVLLKLIDPESQLFLKGYLRRLQIDPSPDLPTSLLATIQMYHPLQLTSHHEHEPQ